MINNIKGDSMSAFTIILGDLVDSKKDGHRQLRNIIDNLSYEKPILSAIGNHDLFFNQWHNTTNNISADLYIHLL